MAELDKQANKREIRHEVMSTAGYVRVQSWTAPLAASATAVHAAVNSNAVITTGITSPAHPRNITVTGAGSGHSAAGTVTINGTDIRGNVISETLTLNSNTTVAGAKAFLTVTSIDMTAVTGNDANDTVEVGTGTKLGLDRHLAVASVLAAYTDGTLDTLPTIAYSNTNVYANTVIMNTAPNGTHNYKVIFVSQETTANTQTTT